ncbi:hypothetical protein LEN26_002766, partial [Aphanomyces euteiches]
ANWLSQGLQNAFVEEFVKFIGDSVKDSRWVRDAKVLQALLDEHLINEIRANRIQNVLDHLGDPKNHIITVLWKLFSKKIEVCAADRLEVFRKVIQEGINSPAASASAARCDRAAEFRKHLLEQLRTGLQSGSTNRFLDSLPDLSGPAFHFDEQPNEVFVESDDSYVCKPVLDVVSKELTSLAKAYEGVNACGDLSEKVLEYIKLASYGIDHGVRPRCGEPCPLCKCPCTREYGHNEKEPKTRHDTIHQPGGLTKEGYRMENMELFAPNCCTAAAEGSTFPHDGKWHSYKDFDKVYPDWSLPVQSEPLKLREYIFYNHQEQLVEIFNAKLQAEKQVNWFRPAKKQVKKCSKIPQGYNHSLDDIENAIKRLVQ